jgi:quinol monooxygenase YgiN
MIVVSGTFNFPAGSADAVKAAMATCVAATLKEEGCITYAFYPDMTQPDVYRVFEEWETMDHLKAHGASAHLGVYREALKAAGIIDRSVKIYEVGKITPI